MYFKLAAAAFAAATALHAAPAAACSTDLDKFAMGGEEAARLYDCIEARLLQGYAQSGRADATAFRDWPRASTFPFVSATHGNRLIHHYVNEIGAAAYMAYPEDGLEMPVGSITAKESFTISRNGDVAAGPLFLMEKVAAGALPETDDWKYVLILPDGRVMGESGTETGRKVTFCHDCHEQVLDGQDGMFYPEPEYRVFE